MVTSKDGAKPQKEYSPGQRPGYKCTYYPARCKRKRSQWNTRSLLPVALSERKLLDSLLPGRCPGLISYWAFSPSLQRANPLFKVKQQNFKPNEATEVIFLIIATEVHGTTWKYREITWNSCCGKQYIPWTKRISCIAVAAMVTSNSGTMFE